MIPYSICIAQIAVFAPNKPNEIRPRGAKLQGSRKAAISRRLDITALRDKLKKKKVSLNDYLLTCSTLAASQIANEAKFL